MKPLSVAELQNLALELKTFEGSRLQEIRLSGDLLLLGVYTPAGLGWLAFDLASQSPQVLWFANLSGASLKDEKKPLILFCRAHLIGARLEEVTAPLDLGRVLILKFNDQRSFEIRLIPRGANVIVSAANKSISLHKPTPLKPLERIDLEILAPSIHVYTPVDVEFESQTLLGKKTSEWKEFKKWGLHARSKNGQNLHEAAEPRAAVDAYRAEWIKKQNKLKKSMASIATDLEKKRNEKWAQAGEWLKIHQSLDVPEEFASCVNPKKSIAFNIEQCFVKAKELQKKIQGAESRFAELQSEFDQIQLKIDQPTDVAQERALTKTVHERPPILATAKARGRTFEVSPQNTLFIGKSAEDNLRLLRAAKSWYYWLHLRDEPSAHGILTRNKNESLSQDILHRAAQILLENNYGQRSSKHYGEKYTVILTECRYVRPIRGDRLGRVNYSNESTFVHLFKNS